jgi:hypothetical protein
MPSGTESVTSSTAFRPPKARDTLSSSRIGAPKAGRGVSIASHRARRYMRGALPRHAGSHAARRSPVAPFPVDASGAAKMMTMMATP